MHKFKIGDFVQMGIPEEEFRREAIRSGSTETYADYIANGGVVEVVNNDNDSIQLLKEGLPRTQRSNWFKMEWFQHADMVLNQIRQESQRL